MREQLAQILSRYDQLTNDLADEKVLADTKRYQVVAKEHADIRETARVAEELKGIYQQIDDDEAVIKANEDEELVELASAELDELQEQSAALEGELKILLVPKDPNDSKNTIMEIRAGTGGDEASLFAADLFRMYERYAETQGWKIEVLSSNGSRSSGFKEVIYLVSGKDAFGALRYESGVHRVQRVPATESQGRTHTSAVSVAVLPEAEDVDIHVEAKDLKVDVYRSSGPGGQSVNTTDSAVRITHIPTGLVVTCQDEKSQHKNKDKAMKVLRARLLEKAQKEQEDKMSAERRTQIGSGDRSAKIRTYNFPQQRVTDHRINLTLYRLNEILEGDLSEVVKALQQADMMEKIKG